MSSENIVGRWLVRAHTVQIVKPSELNYIFPRKWWKAIAVGKNRISFHKLMHQEIVQRIVHSIPSTDILYAEETKNSLLLIN